MTQTTSGIEIEQARKWVEQYFVGFSPSTSSVKPVHIANGLYRTVLNGRADTGPLNRAVFVSTNKGVVPKGHSLKAVRDWLTENKRIDDEVSDEDLLQLRKLLYRVLHADNAVYNGGMESYSAGYRAFVSNDRIGQDGGEFAGFWLMRYAPDLGELVKSSLNNKRDVITIATAPLLDQGWKEYSPEDEPANDLKDVECFVKPTATVQERFGAVANAAATLNQHLRSKGNKLLHLRQIVSFTCLLLTRHLAWLEYYYLGTPPAIFLLDFSADNRTAVARASQLSYSRVGQSISRFYGWAFEQYLHRDWGRELSGGQLISRLAQEQPTYKNKTSNESQQHWQLAGEARDSSSYAHAVYDILAMMAESNPINYLRQLGVRSGLMLPRSNRQPAKRFVLRQDLLEVMIRSVVAPGESIDMSELLTRLWNTYHIIVGGRDEDVEHLLAANIYQADAQALQENSRNLALRLQELSFARLLADGVLEVSIGGNNAT